MDVIGMTVTVVGMFYNQAKWVDAWCRSVLGQSQLPAQVVVSNDASTDNTEDKLNEWTDRFAMYGVDYLICTQKANIGFKMSYKSLIPYIRGEYIAILEGDDLYHAEKLEKSVKYLRDNPQLEAVHTDFDMWKETPEGAEVIKSYWKTRGRQGDDDNPGELGPIPEGFVFDELLKNNFMMTCTFVGTRKAWEYYKADLFEERDYIMADYPWFLGLARNNQIGYIDEALSIYNCHPNGIVNNPSKRDKVIADTQRIKDDARKGLL